MWTLDADALHAFRQHVHPVAEREARLERPHDVMEPFRGEAPEVPGMPVPRHEHHGGEDRDPAGTKHAVNLLDSAERVMDVLEHLDADNGTNRAVGEGQLVNV